VTSIRWWVACVLTIGCADAAPTTTTVIAEPVAVELPTEVVTLPITPAPAVAVPDPVLDLAVSYGLVCVVLRDGSAWCNHGGGPDLGMWRLDARSEHARIAIAGGEVCTCDLSGAVHCWHGLFQPGGPTERDFPELAGCVEIAGHYPFLCTLGRDGTMACVDELQPRRTVSVAVPSCADGRSATLSMGIDYACISSPCGLSGCWSLAHGRHGGACGDLFPRLRTALDDAEHFEPTPAAHIAGGRPYTCELVDDDVLCAARPGRPRGHFLRTENREPLRLSVPGQHLIDVHVAHSFVFAVTDDGDVYRWGCDEAIERCHGRTTRETPTLMATGAVLPRGMTRGDLCFVDEVRDSLICQYGVDDPEPRSASIRAMLDAD
jgi:hypothetical protein